MGYAIAAAFVNEGATVNLVSGPVQISLDNQEVNICKVTSAEEMNQKASALFPDMDIIVFAAAVADYRPENQQVNKIKRTGAEMTLKLVPNEDIAGKLGKQRSANQILVGFALESENGESNAFKKLTDKNLDMIIINKLNEAGAGFNVDTNKIIIIKKDNNQKEFELKSKDDVASDIINEIFNLMINRSHA